jgi:hypothetical protein
MGAVWKETYLLRGTGSKQIKLPLYGARHVEVTADATNIKVVKDAAQATHGGETVDVSGNSILLRVAQKNDLSKKHQDQ